ncbi:MAG TPA: ABC transporter permease subunit, partial [Magnetospirillaceae bacterium]|nr:ABC transporter permease subunit [Magnetospirillaceae bacterium]
ASRRAEFVLGSAVRVLHPVPKIAFLPVFMILFGIGDLPKVLFVASVAVFQTVISVWDGIAEIPGRQHLAARSLGMDRWALLCHLYIPAVLPRTLTSTRLGLGIGFSALFFAENFATRFGVGYLIMNAYAMADYRTTYAGIVALSLLALALFGLVDAAEKRLCPWLRAGKVV